MRITGLDHIVLAVADIERTKEFYKRTLGVEAVEQRPGQWALVMGKNRISLQKAGAMPALAVNTTAGSANFCLITDEPIAEVAEALGRHGVKVLEGPIPRIGAAGPIVSVYFRDPDGNLVEVSNVV